MSSPDSVSTKLERIAKLAKQMRGAVLTSLSHHIDVEWLHEAYRRTRKDGAAGVDGQTAAEYARNLEANLQSLLDRNDPLVLAFFRSQGMTAAPFTPLQMELE